MRQVVQASLVVLVLVASVFADPALITPTPKKIEVARDVVDLAGASIVLAGAEPKLRVAADEINHRLTEELGAVALPVVDGGIDEVPKAKACTIVVGVSGTKAMAAVEKVYPVAVPEKPEGYGIRTHISGTKRIVVLSGRDAQGALYAAVTLRCLLDAAGGSKIANGRAVLRPASVEDWPDFRWREIGSLSVPHSQSYYPLLQAVRRGQDEKAEEYGRAYVADVKAYVDILLRHKVNLCGEYYGNYLTVPGMRKFARRINDYGRARGIDFFASGSTNIGTYPADKDDPAKSRCIDYRTHKKYFCWSLLEEHEKKTSLYAEAMKEAGFRWLYMHATDGGGWENPAKWNDRCQQCRNMYGDDHAKADATIFGMYYRKIKARIPDFRMVAVVYPYNARAIDPDSIEKDIVAKSGSIPTAGKIASQAAGKHQVFLARLGKLMDPAIKICQREVTRARYALMTKCYGRRDFQMYMEFEGWPNKWAPIFSLTPRWAKTYYRPGHEDIFYPRHGRWGYNILSELLAAEFGWNTEAPGAIEYPGNEVRLNDIDHHGRPHDLAVTYLRRLCAGFWGPEVGPHMVDVFDSNISCRFIQRPELIGESMGIANPLERMKQMAAATSRAMAAMEKARAAYDAAAADGRRAIPNAAAERLFGDYYRGMLAARCASAFRAAMMEARRAVIGGQIPKAKEIEARARALVAREQAAWKQRWPWMSKVAHTEGINPNWVYTFGKFSRYDYAALVAELDTFAEGRDALFEAYNTPAWFKKALASRVLYAVPAPEPIVLDGRLDEAAWTAAPVNGHFVNYRTSTLAARETDARILYDADYLYVGFTACEPSADKLDLPRFDNDTDFNRSCSVEVFVDSDGDRGSYVHFIWDPAGNILDERRARNAHGQFELSRTAFNSRAEVAAARFADRWTIEARIPVADLGAKPRAGARWRANLCRNLARPDGTNAAVSTVLLEGSGFHSPEKFAELRFLAQVPPHREPVVRLAIEPKRAGQRTIGTGVGFEALFGLKLETTTPLHDVSLAAEVFCGDARKGELKVFSGASVPLMWRTRKAIRHLVDTPEPGLEFVFRVKAAEGRWTFRRVFGNPPLRSVEPTYVEGASGKALAGTVHFPAALQGVRYFDSRRGTLEMWVKVEPPLAPVLQFGRDRDHVFFFQGPVRFDHPRLDNWQSVCVRRRRGSVAARLSTFAWQQLASNASLSAWQDGGWHHLAAQWSGVDSDALSFDLYVGGKKIGGVFETRLQEKVWRKKAEDFPVQLGAAVTGACPLGWAMDEVRVSAVPRYAADFAPERRAVLDEKATVVFHFDGDLAGETHGDAKITAVAGPGR